MKKQQVSSYAPSLLGSAIVVLLLSLVPTLTKAQTSPSGRTLEISPPQQEMSINPGASESFKVKVSNPSTEDLAVKVRTEDFTAKGEEGQVALTETSGDYSVVRWVTFQPEAFTLKPGQSQEVTASITVPVGSGGGRYGALVFSITGQAEEGNNTKQAIVAQEVASLFLVNVNGPKIEKISLDSFTIPKFQEFGPVPMTLSYTNNGNVHLKPQGIIAVTDMFGKKAVDVVVPGFNVFPGAKRVVNTSWDRKMIIGKYTANAIVYSNGTTNDTMTATTTFIVFPVRIAAIILVTLILLYVIRHRLIRAFKVLAGK